MENATKTNKKKKGKKKPLRRAENWGMQVPALMGRMAVSMIIIVVLGLMFSALQAVGATLRLVLAIAILAGILLLFFSEGLNKGAEDAAASRSYVNLESKGLKMDKKDDAACYHVLKPIAAGLAAFSIPLALAIIVALSAKEYTYTLQDLPTWLTDSYGTRADVMAPLGAYTTQHGMTAYDWMRTVVRMMEMNFINLFRDPLTMSATIDRLSPLFIATYPIAFVLGYLRGPASNRKMEKLNRRAKKVAVRRTQKKSLVEELTGAQGQVHYGHKKEEHKKKELI